MWVRSGGLGVVGEKVTAAKRGRLGVKDVINVDDSAAFAWCFFALCFVMVDLLCGVYGMEYWVSFRENGSTVVTFLVPNLLSYEAMRVIVAPCGGKRRSGMRMDRTA